MKGSLKLRIIFSSIIIYYFLNKGIDMKILNHATPLFLYINYLHYNDTL